MTLRLRFTGRVDQLNPDDRARLMGRTTTIRGKVMDQVRQMAETIETQGEAALLEYTRQFDEVELSSLRVPEEALQEAHQEVEEAFLHALRRAAEQVRAYHQTTTAGGGERFEGGGVTAWERTVPLDRVGIYVPGGRAAYPSTVVMTVVPAQVAGVPEIVVASPPGPDGLPDQLVLAACHELGVDHVIPLGGAQAVLGLALGAGPLPRCQAVVGPGNAYVQAAKELVAGRVRIDSPAGPSEVAVLVQHVENAPVAAAELIAQAEHAPDTLSVGVCMEEGVALAVHDELDARLQGLPRAEVVREALERQGGLLVETDLDEVVAFLDELAPEHCLLLHDAGPELAEQLSGPACIVAGPGGRVPITDYVAGPSHVLPTGGHASAWSGLGVDTFTKRVHVALIDELDPALAEAGRTLARLEGLEGHARAMEEGSP